MTKAINVRNGAYIRGIAVAAVVFQRSLIPGLEIARDGIAMPMTFALSSEAPGYVT